MAAMSALIKELRNTHPRDSGYAELANEAADEIERLQKAVEAERERCAAVCEGWIGTFQDRDIQYTSARAYAIGAIEDIADLIRDGTDPRVDVSGAAKP